MTKVYIVESEAGWGQRIDEVIDFPTKQEAEDFCRKYNKKYNPPLEDTPSWYMFAYVEGQPFSMLR